jgi:hypothetical protein
MLNPTLFFVAIAICIGWLMLVFELVRRRKLTEGLSFIWVGASMGLMLCIIFSRAFTGFSRMFGIKYPEGLVLILGLGVLSLSSLYLCVRISDLYRRTIRLTEEIAILKAKERKPE